jgi:hypothetical protein
MNFLNKIRRKSLEQQKMIAMGFSFVVTAFIFAIWVLTIIYGFSGFENKDNNINTASPVNVVTDQVKNLFNSKETYIAD